MEQSFHQLDPILFNNGVGQETLAHGLDFGLRAGPIVRGELKFDELPHPHILHAGIAQRAEGMLDSLALGVQDASLQGDGDLRSEEHTSELQSLAYLVCRLLLEKKKTSQMTLQHQLSQC